MIRELQSLYFSEHNLLVFFYTTLKSNYLICYKNADSMFSEYLPDNFSGKYQVYKGFITDITMCILSNYSFVVAFYCNGQSCACKIGLRYKKSTDEWLLKINDAVLVDRETT